MYNNLKLDQKEDLIVISYSLTSGAGALGDKALLPGFSKT